MPGRDITYTTRDGENFTGYMAEPEGGGKVPGIVLITAIFGIDDEMKELTDAWAEDGFIVSVPDIFWRVMPGASAAAMRTMPPPSLARMQREPFTAH